MKKILIVHNYYTQKVEDTVVSDEIFVKKYIVENLTLQ